MKKKSILLAVLAAVMVIGAGAGAAHAYFTARTTARGGVEIELGTHTVIEEPEVVDWTKNIVISNEADSKQDVWVRAKTFYPVQYPVVYVTESANWTKEADMDGWVYYMVPLAPGEAADSLLAKITGVPETDVKETEFNVTVVYEAVPVEYDSEGNAVYTDADWDYSYDSNPTRGGN